MTKHAFVHDLDVDYNEDVNAFVHDIDDETLDAIMREARIAFEAIKAETVS